jgi:hypothetical protein
VNLGDVERDYQLVLAGFAQVAVSGEELSEDVLLEVRRRLDAVREQVMRRIDHYPRAPGVGMADSGPDAASCRADALGPGSVQGWGSCVT